jgi:hypothetical protein
MTTATRNCIIFPTPSCVVELNLFNVSKATPLPQCRHHRGRRYSTYSFLTSTLDRVSGQRHAPAALYSQGKDPTISIGQEARRASELVWTQRLQKNPLPPPGSNSIRPVVQSVVETIFTSHFPRYESFNFCFHCSFYLGLSVYECHLYK